MDKARLNREIAEQKAYLASVEAKLQALAGLAYENDLDLPLLGLAHKAITQLHMEELPEREPMAALGRLIDRELERIMLCQDLYRTRAWLKRHAA